ncbi:MAG: cytochrome c3 family protein [Deltaproteobacteria bacterium]|nr:cytochrome c3 family protein [Deltaproteobacteria bacterium]
MTTVDDSAFAERMRPRVAFYHEDHNEKAELEDCATCHHLYEDGLLVEDESSEDMECSACHGKPEDKHQLSLVSIYHKQCKGCHLEQKAGPVMCSECHVKTK